MGLFTLKPEEVPSALEATSPTMPLAQPQHPKNAVAATSMTIQSAREPTGISGGKSKLTLANLLHGCNADDLGFNPAVIPPWLSTTVDNYLLQQQAPTGSYVFSLGTLLDGVADHGFRTILSGAKRDFQIQLPSNEVFHALTAVPDGVSQVPTAAITAVPPPATTLGAPKSVVLPPERAAGNPRGAKPPAVEPVALPAPAGLMTFTPFGNPGVPSVGIQTPTTPAAPASSIVAASPPAPSPMVPSPPPFPMAPEAPKQAQPAMGASVQPLAGAFHAFSSPVIPAAEPPTTVGKPIQPIVKAFDPFAPSPSAPPAKGLSSDQLLGNSPALSTGSLFKPSQSLNDPFASLPAPKRLPEEPVSPLIPAEPKPSSFFSAPIGATAESAPTRPILNLAAGPISNPFATPKETPPAPSPPQLSGFFTGASDAIAQALPNLQAASPSPAPSAAFPPIPAPSAAPAAKLATAAKSSFLALSAIESDSDQLLLRALLGVEESLDASRVVQLLANQPGLSACVYLNDSCVLGHADSSVADAVIFQQQAADIASQLRGLAPLIGIDGAETFTLNAGGRLLTFCFPTKVTTVGVLHRGEPGTGLRDKITLVARELARLFR
jgi:hypothetical protein